MSYSKVRLDGGIDKAVVIVGNGFDLAHGFKTDYLSFANWLMKDLVGNVYREFNSDKPVSKGFLDPETYHVVNNRDDYNEDHDWLYPLQQVIRFGEESDLLKHIVAYPLVLSHILRSEFLSKLYKDKIEGWFDVEHVYFNLLCEFSSDTEAYRVDDLNKDLMYVKKMLSLYLSEIKYTFNENIDRFIQREFRDFSEIVFINFNYTESIDKYVNSYPFSRRVTVVNIHGTLSEENPILGYGNDEDANYKNLKKLEKNNLLEHFKTVDYLLASNHKKFLTVINSLENYEAFVLGHSLGLTDKTLLKQVFDDARCKKIHVFNRLDLKKSQEELVKIYKLTVMSLIRVMGAEVDLRQKLVDFTETGYFPLE